MFKLKFRIGLKYKNSTNFKPNIILSTKTNQYENKKSKWKRHRSSKEIWCYLIKQHSDLNPYFIAVESVDKAYRKFLESCLDADDKLLLVAESNGKLMGYTIGVIKERSQIFEINENGYIRDIFVKEEYRECGIAKDILERTQRVVWK